MKNLIKERGTVLNIGFGTLLLRMGLLWSAVYSDFKKLRCSALRAMTDPKGERAVILFGIFIQLLKLCGAIQKFD